MPESKMYRHCRTVYERMLEEADKDSNGNNIYRGFLSILVRDDLHLPIPYYTTIKQTLEQLGCIEQLKRGGGTTYSEWRLFFPPDQHLFEQSRSLIQRRKMSSMAMIEQSITALNNRLVEVERQVAWLLKEVADGNSLMGGSESLPEMQDTGT
jgi:hypothetical protein